MIKDKKPERRFLVGFKIFPPVCAFRFINLEQRQNNHHYDEDYSIYFESFVHDQVNYGLNDWYWFLNFR